MRKSLWSGMAAAATLALVGAATADAPKAARLGETIHGSLGARDAKTEARVSYDEFTVDLAAGQGIEATLRSTEFDAALEVGRGLGDAFKAIKSDDDGAGGQDARLRFTAETAGRYTLRAQSVGAGMSGAYDLGVIASTPPPAAVPRPIALGQTVESRLSETGPRTDDDRLFQTYRFPAHAGDRVSVALRSRAFDGTLELRRVGATDDEAALGADDDSGGDRNPRILTALPETGEYEIRAMAAEANAGGPYTLSLTQLPPPPPAPRVKMIPRGRNVSGVFGAASAMLDDFRPYDYYAIRGRAGETVRIAMMSDDLDPTLEVGALTAAGFAVAPVEEVSDGVSARNVKLKVKFEESGVVVLRAGAAAQGAAGKYAIAVLN